MSQLLTLAKGDTGPLVVTVSHTTLGSGGLNAFHTGTGKLWFYGKYDVSDPDSSAVFEKTLASGISVTVDGNNTTTDGVVSITLLPSDTTSIPVDSPITLYCSLKGFDGTNEFTITRDILLLVAAQATSKVS